VRFAVVEEVVGVVFHDPDLATTFTRVPRELANHEVSFDVTPKLRIP
jgi:hypothetical protein